MRTNSTPTARVGVEGWRPAWYRWSLALLAIAYIVSAVGLSGVPGVARSAFVAAVALSALLLYGMGSCWIGLPLWVALPIPFLFYSLMTLGWAEMPQWELLGPMFTSWVGCCAVGIALHNRMPWRVIEYGLVLAVLANVVADVLGFDAYVQYEADVRDLVGEIRSSGLIGNANEYAARTISPALVLWAFPGKFTVLGQTFSLAAAAYGLVKSGSRLGLLLTAFLLLIVLWRALQSRQRRVWVPLLVAAACLAWYYCKQGDLPSDLNLTALQRLEVGLAGKESSFNDRQWLIETGWKLFGERPLLGYGLGSFGDVSGTGYYAHNNYVELAVNGGIMSLLLYYAIHSAIAWQWFRRDLFELGPLLLLLAVLAADVANVTYYNRMTCLILVMLACHVGQGRVVQTRRWSF